MKAIKVSVICLVLCAVLVVSFYPILELERTTIIRFALGFIIIILFMLKKDDILGMFLKNDTSRLKRSSLPEDENILDHIERIIEITRRNGIDESLGKGEQYLEFVTGKLGINPVQAILFSYFVENSYESGIKVSDIANYIKCKNIKMIKYMDDFEELERKKFIVCNRNSWGTSYSLAQGISVSLLNNEFVPKKDLILFDDITPREMFYNQRETNEVNKLISMLAEENYNKIQDRLNSKNMKKGFACLFSGLPGTGKTETAYQIARETKRNIMMVDISETRSMWHGESEKNIKELFDTYRAAVEKSETVPILLINEADAIIGKRMQIGISNRSVDQTENRTQNVILQEMENLAGILIATTNLTQNMDTAFERRFLYKITFDKPDMESRVSIWKSLLPDLKDDMAIELSSYFELSGGQIENIARKTEVDSIINGGILSMDTLMGYCKAEILNDLNTSSIS
jgi:hypothetical protein